MRTPISWLADHAALPAGSSQRAIADALVRVGLEVESVRSGADDVSGPIVVGRVLEFQDEPQKNGKTIRWCQVDVGEDEPRGIVCGASNFAAGDLVVVSLPGAVLPGDFAISARKTYGHISDGMICSARELAIGEEHDGILVLPPDAGKPGDDGLDALGLRDAVLDVTVTTDRGYCLSVRGLAREAAAAFGVAFTDVSADLPAVDGRAYAVRIADPAGCDRFSVRAVTGLDPAASTPDWLATRLRQCGMRPISLAVDVTNYVMLETGQPLHAFDRSKLRGPLVARRARPEEKLTTLDGVARNLDPDDMVVADDTGAVALAGVMGGAATEIDAATTDIVLEAAHWDPASIAYAARRHKLPSEAARRFARDVDPEIAGVALQHCVELLVRYGGAQAVGGYTVVGEPREPLTIAFDPRHPERLAGMPIPDDEVAATLQAVGCEVSPGQDGRLAVLVPSWRPDLLIPADLVEEVVRLVGYDKLPSVLPAAPPGGGLTASQRFRAAISRAVAASGCVEVLSYPFVSPTIHDVFGLDADDPRRDALRLVNPLSDTEPELRTSLLPGLLATVQRNLGRGLRDLALFEMGLVYHPRPGSPTAALPPVDRRPSEDELAAVFAAVPDQPLHLAAVFAGDVEPLTWQGPARPATWADAVAVAEVVARCARQAVTVQAGHQAPWHPGRCAQLRLDGRVAGYAGELHPRVVAALGLPERACAVELDLSCFDAPGPASAPTLSTHPPVLLDVALVVPDGVPAADVQAALVDGAGKLLESVRIFDVYRDEQRLGAGSRSLAFELRFRAPDRTLTVEEATARRDAAIARAAEATGAALRS